MTSSPGMITNASSPAPGNAPVMMSSFSIAITSREGGDGVCPGPSLSEDRVVRVGRDADLVAGEIRVVNLPVRVMTLQCRGEPVRFQIVDPGAVVCGRHRRVCHDEADPRVEPRDRVEPVHFAACTFCGFAIFMEEAEDDEILSVHEAKKFYKSKKN